MNLDRIISNYAPESKTFIVDLPAGEKFEFKTISDYAELQKLKREAENFSRQVRNGKGTKFKEFKDFDDQTLRSCYFVHYSMLASWDAPEDGQKPEEVDKGDKWSQLETLKVARSAGWLIEFFINELQLKQNAFTGKVIKERLEDLGND